MKTIFTLLLSCYITLGLAQQIDVVDFKTISAEVSFDPENEAVLGTAHIDFAILKPTDSIFIDAKNMEIINFTGHHHDLDFEYNGKQIIYKTNFKIGETYTLNISYKTKPNKALYFIDWNKNKNHPEYNPQIWTQGQGKYTSNWLPSIDDMNDKIIFDLAITFNNNFNVMANGVLKVKQIGETQTKWFYSTKNPMSSYLVALAIGRYDAFTETSKTGVPLEFYYYPKDSLKVEPTYRHSKHMFNFLETEIGVAYPWQNYKQVPVKDFLYAGMENTSCTIFSDAFVVDEIEFNDINYINVNAHELAHQWFGNLITETSGTHHWLQEGFATYYALLAEKELFGEDYYYEQLYNYSQELLEQDLAGQSTALLNPQSSSTTFYKKGAWVLHVLREQIGDKAFREAVRNYLKTYQFKNVKTKDFITEAEKTSGQNLSEFVKLWLEDQTLYFNLIEESLNKSDFYREFQKADCGVKNGKCKDWLRAPISDKAKTKIINQQPELISKETFNNPLKVRQAIAFTLQKIPLSLKTEFESLLKDKSYLTQEAALYKLWVNFPEDGAINLDKMKFELGNNDKNIRLLWLVLALNTANYEDAQKENYFAELVEYTNPIHSFSLRQNAFMYLRDLNAINSDVIKNLEEAKTHHNWRFKSFTTKMLEDLNQQKK
jgi:aminopeptidase N